MKVRYDVGKFAGLGSMRFLNQKEAFDLAKKIAAQDKFGESWMAQLTWDDKGFITQRSVAVRADGTFRRLS